jgi:Uma2 family endonuclease
MAVHTAFNISALLPATLTAPGLSEAQFISLCDEFPDCTLEYTADGTVIVMPPTDPESSARVVEAVRQLANWALAQGRGIVIGPDGGLFLPEGSRHSPDAAWFDAARWQAAKTPDRRFPVFVPEFLIEVRSPEQRARLKREKMEDYIANGVQLAWLIDPMENTVTIYRIGRAPEVLARPASVAGEGPVEGFVLNLERILQFN